MSNSEIKQIWERIVSLERGHSGLYNSYNSTLHEIRKGLEEAVKRSPEYEKEAQQASRKTSEFRNRASETLEEVRQILESIKTGEKEAEQSKNSTHELLKEIKESHVQFLEEKSNIDSKVNEVLEKLESIQHSISKFETTLENHPDLEEEISEFESHLSVNELGDDIISSELKVHLLQDFLQMYSENPGKLISDYNSSDHPIMQLLENSNKLEKTISKLEKIPGMQKIVSLLEKKSVERLEKTTELVEKNLDRVIAVTTKHGPDEEEESA